MHRAAGHVKSNADSLWNSLAEGGAGWMRGPAWVHIAFQIAAPASQRTSQGPCPPGRRPVTLAGPAMNPDELDRIPLFANLSPDQRARVAATARPVHFAPGEVIVNRGEFSFDFYAITSGAAEVRQGETRVAELGVGDVVGEMGVLPAASQDRRRGATVIVTEPTDALSIDGRELRRMTDEIPALADALRELVAERARALGQA